MPKTGYETIHEALTTLEFFMTAYASSEQYQERKNEVIAILRNRAESEPHSYHSKLMVGFAKAVEDIG